jgi:hypothetical protein
MQVTLKPLEIMPILNKSGLLQTAFLPEKLEEAGNSIREWIRSPALLAS